MICLQSFERTFHSLTNIQCRKPRLIRPLTHATIDLCRDDRLITPSATLRKPTTDNLLCYSLPKLPTINICSIKEIDAKVERLVHDGKGIFFGCLRTEVHSAQTQTRNF